MYFMHLKYDNKLYLIFFISSLFFLAAFIIITMFDTLRRGDIYEIKAEPIDKNSSIYDSIPSNSHDSEIIDSLTHSSDTTNLIIDTTK